MTSNDTNTKGTTMKTQTNSLSPSQVYPFKFEADNEPTAKAVAGFMCDLGVKAKHEGSGVYFAKEVKGSKAATLRGFVKGLEHASYGCE